MHSKKLALIALLGATSGFGGQIQIGGANGLTGNYISSNCPVGISNCLISPAPDHATASMTTAATLISYNTTLFASAFNGSTAPNVGAGPLVDHSTQANSVTGGTGVSFNLINDGNGNDNTWQMTGSQNGQEAVYIPVGLQNVSSVWAMLNAENGAQSTAKEAWIAFDFGTAANSTTGLTTLTVKLQDTSGTTSGVGVEQNALACTAGCPNVGGSQPSTLGANGSPAASLDGATLIEHLSSGVGLTVGAAGSAVNDATVYTNNLFSYGYTSGGSGTAGNAVLNDLGFVFTPTFLASISGDYLVDVRIIDTSSSGVSGNSLSAITAITATPEPSTWLLLIAGVSAIGVRRFRRSARCSV